MLDDAHDEGEEMFTLALSNASGAWRQDSEATGTIENADLMPAALLARFGRAMAEQVVQHIEERRMAPRERGFRARFAGQELRSGSDRGFALGFLSQFGQPMGGNMMGAAGTGASPMGAAPAGAHLAGPGAPGMTGMPGMANMARPQQPMGGASAMGAAPMGAQLSGPGAGMPGMMAPGGQQPPMGDATRFVGTPRVGYSASSYGRDYRMGYALGLLDSEELQFEVGVDAQRQENQQMGAVSNGVVGRASIGW